MAASRAVGGPVYEVLSSWLPKPVIDGRAPFVAELLIQEISSDAVEALILDLDALCGRVTVHRGDLDEWQLPALERGELPAYVAPGPSLERRISHAGLFADRVLLPPPELPQWNIGNVVNPRDIPSLLRGGREELDRLRRDSCETAAPMRDSDTDLFDEIDAVLAEDARDSLQDLERVLPQVRAALRPVAEELLGFWWNISDGLADGWVNVVEKGLLISDNVKAIAKDPEFRADLETLIATHQGYSFESWRDVMTATGLAHNLGRAHVLTFPADQLTRDLVALTSRYFTDLPYGGAMFGLSYPTRRLQIAGGADVERGAWFDEVMLGLGPAANLLDLHTVRELRQDGTAVTLRRWISEDLNRVAFAAARGDSIDEALDEASHRLGLIAAAADTRINATGSDLTRRRLKQAGIWGGSALLAGFAGTLATGGALPVAAAVAGIGFALSGVAGAVATDSRNLAAPDPVIYELMAHLHTKK